MKNVLLLSLACIALSSCAGQGGPDGAPGVFGIDGAQWGGVFFGGVRDAMTGQPGTAAMSAFERAQASNDEKAARMVLPPVKPQASVQDAFDVPSPVLETIAAPVARPAYALK